LCCAKGGGRLQATQRSEIVISGSTVGGNEVIHWPHSYLQWFCGWEFSQDTILKWESVGVAAVTDESVPTETC